MLTIVYHRPGVAREEELVRRLASLVSAARGERVAVVRLGDPLPPDPGRLVLLMHMRGGHWLWLRRVAGSEPVIVPAPVTASWIYGEALRLCGPGLCRVYLVYMRARRAAGLQASDLERVVAMLSGAGVEAEAVSVERPGAEPAGARAVAGSCIAVPMAMFRGGLHRSASLLASRLGCGCAEPMARSGFAALASWLTLL